MPNVTEMGEAIGKNLDFFIIRQWVLFYSHLFIMIFQATDIIRSELTNNGIGAELGNIGEILSNPNSGADTNIVISLINIEENRVSRNPQNYIRNGTGVIYKNPAVNLYLTLLFTSVRDNGGYGLALQSLQNLIGFFQKKYVFDHSNTPALDPGIEKLILDMISMNVEQLQLLWSMLGGKYHPSIAYRMRMITIDSTSDQTASPISEISFNYLKTN